MLYDVVKWIHLILKSKLVENVSDIKQFRFFLICPSKNVTTLMVNVVGNRYITEVLNGKYKSIYNSIPSSAEIQCLYSIISNVINRDRYRISTTIK